MPTYQLNEDSLAGFKEAVNNGQNRLALEYAVKVIANLQEEIEEVRKAVEASVAPSRKTTKTATTEDAKDVQPN